MMFPSEPVTAITTQSSERISQVLVHPLYQEMESAQVEAFRDIVTLATSRRADINVALVDRAFRFAYQAHRGQFRLSGEPYMVHLIENARLLA